MLPRQGHVVILDESTNNKNKYNTNEEKVLGDVWLKELKFNEYCSTFVLFDKKIQSWTN
jgi:hypothetical protein